MKIYRSRNASTPNKVRISVAEKKFEISTVNLDFFKDKLCWSEYLENNLLATGFAVPDDGTIIPKSVVICCYLNELVP